MCIRDRIKDDDARLSILGGYLENIKGTVFRQTQFAEFELRMHEMAQKGQPITGDALSKLYMDITRKYYGHDQGICIVDDYIQHEWSFIPHFYRNFYVFQYATSFTASVTTEQSPSSFPMLEPMSFRSMCGQEKLHSMPSAPAS